MVLNLNILILKDIKLTLFCLNKILIIQIFIKKLHLWFTLINIDK